MLNEFELLTIILILTSANTTIGLTVIGIIKKDICKDITKIWKVLDDMFPRNERKR